MFELYLDCLDLDEVWNHRIFIMGLYFFLRCIPFILNGVNFSPIDCLMCFVKIFRLENLYTN